MQRRLDQRLGFLRHCLFTGLLAGVLASHSVAQQIPATEEKTIRGTTVSLPDAASGKPLLLIVGFTHKSSGQCDAWAKQLAPVYLKDERVLYYEAADFQGVPSLIMKMILHGMRKEIPSDRQPRFVLLESNEEQWKKLVNYSAPEEAYVIVADSSGKVVWQTRGRVSNEQIAALKTEVTKLIPVRP